MEEKRMVIVGVGAVLVIMTTTLLAVTLTQNEEPGDIPSPSLNKTKPLLLVSLDGFRFDYIKRPLPSLQTFAQSGVTAPFMLPSYPTLTFPNHYTIVTGLYPNDHGIVANNFFDPDFEESFSPGVEGGKWWGGEPIWNTLTLQNKTSATFFWPGSDKNISGLYPTYYYDYDPDVPYDQRIDQVLEWLSLPEEKRPDFVSLYFREPDHTAHDFGPDSPEVEAKLEEMDAYMSRLFRGLRERKLEDEVNIIVLADHGMARSGEPLAINLTHYSSNVNSLTSHGYYGSFTTLMLKEPSQANIENILNDLTCSAEQSYMRAFVPQDLPKRYHHSKNKRIGDIVLDLDSGYFTSNPNHPEYTALPGQHGYDNHFSSMGALFIASGPDFKKNVVVEPFQNIELYNLMCYLLEVEPAPNNGTEGALYSILLDPPPVPELPVEAPPAAATFPSSLDNNSTLQMANCPGDGYNGAAPVWLQEINIPEAERKVLEERHLPWGIPLSGNRSDNLLLLHHVDHVTGYSEHLKMPIWTSFSLTEVSYWIPPLNSSLWNTDVRLSPNNTPSCQAYEDSVNVTMFPLFHPVFANASGAPEIPFLVSNAVPLVTTGKTEDTMEALLKNSWSLHTGPLNFVMGIAFDYDADSLPDDTINATTLAVPSHLYIIVTHCRQVVNSLSECQEEDLDAQPFIFPQLQTADNACLTGMKFASFHLSKVRDVEMLTGLTFFPNLELEARLQLALRIQTYVWRG